MPTTLRVAFEIEKTARELWRSLLGTPDEAAAYQALQAAITLSDSVYR